MGFLKGYLRLSSVFALLGDLAECESRASASVNLDSAPSSISEALNSVTLAPGASKSRLIDPTSWESVVLDSAALADVAATRTDSSEGRPLLVIKVFCGEEVLADFIRCLACREGDVDAVAE